MKSQLIRLFKTKTDSFVIIYVGMSSSSDGSWLFPDGSLSFEEIIQLKDDFGQSDKRKLFIVLDSNNQNAFLQKVNLKP